ncbi:MAG: hypothetical protein ACXVEF_16500 [Polyangiales bacterium]
MQASYPTIAPPFDREKHDEWSKSDAQSYFEWFLAVKQERVETLRSFFALPVELRGEALLRVVDEKLKPFVASEGARLVNGTVMLPEGTAVCFDVGVLFGEELIAAAPALRWEIDVSARRSFNWGKPLLRLRHDDVCEPIHLVEVSLMHLVAQKKASLADSFRWTLEVAPRA